MFMIPRPWKLRQEDCKLEASLRCVVKPKLTSYPIPKIMKEVVTVQKKSYLLRFLKKSRKDSDYSNDLNIFKVNGIIVRG